MASGIRLRLERLTNPDMKRFVSEAVKAANDPQGKKLMTELNKYWASALKAAKEYDKLVAIIEKSTVQLKHRLEEVGDAAFGEVQSLISYANKELKPIAAAVSGFEKTEALIVKKYPSLKKVDTPRPG
jgi:hypothetical protein